VVSVFLTARRLSVCACVTRTFIDLGPCARHVRVAPPVLRFSAVDRIWAWVPENSFTGSRILRTGRVRLRRLRRGGDATGDDDFPGAGITAPDVEHVDVSTNYGGENFSRRSPRYHVPSMSLVSDRRLMTDSTGNAIKIVDVAEYESMLCSLFARQRAVLIRSSLCEIETCKFPSKTGGCLKDHLESGCLRKSRRLT
jgi:hypothetical protein